MNASTEYDPSYSRLYGSEFSAGAMVGPYIVERQWHRGALATLYRARHEKSGEPAALKVLHQQLSHSGKMLRRFEQESDALRRLQHPNIVEILESGELRDGRPFIATKWLDGRTLGEEIEQRGSFSAREAVSVVEQVGAALSAAHSLGIVHRDLKASNVMALRSGQGFTIKLLDFGIAKFLDPTFGAGAGLTSTGAVLGSPVSMAPEQIRGEPSDERTDIYALGVLLYQLLTGQPPFRGASYIEVEEMHLHAPAPRPGAAVPSVARFDPVVTRCLEKNRALRFDRVALVVEEVRRAFEAKAEAAQPAQRGIALYVQVYPLDENELSEETDEKAEAMLESARQSCRDSQMQLSLDSGHSFLALCPLPLDESAEREARERTVRVAIRTFDRLQELGHGARVRSALLLHAGPLSNERGSTGSLNPHETDLMAVSQWVPSHCPSGLLASRSALIGLEGTVVARPLENAGDFCSIQAGLGEGR